MPGSPPETLEQDWVSIDVFQGKHTSHGDSDALLKHRRLLKHPKHGWIYDCWVDSAFEHVVSSPEGRFAIPHMLRNMRSLGQELTAAVASTMRGGFNVELPRSESNSLPESTSPK